MRIQVNQIQPFPQAVFEVVVEEERGDKTTHKVSLKEDYYNKLANNKSTPEDLIKRSFEFLLTREPKESILGEFDLSVIQEYFPEYEKNIK